MKCDVMPDNSRAVIINVGVQMICVATVQTVCDCPSRDRARILASRTVSVHMNKNINSHKYSYNCCEFLRSTALLCSFSCYKARHSILQLCQNAGLASCHTNKIIARGIADKCVKRKETLLHQLAYNMIFIHRNWLSYKIEMLIASYCIGIRESLHYDVQQCVEIPIPTNQLNNKTMSRIISRE